MIVAMMEEEDAYDADDQENLTVLTALRQMQLDDAKKPKRGGSKPGRRKSKKRQRLEGHAMLFSDYFADDSTYDEKDFRRRYRMNKEVFFKLLHGMEKFETKICISNCRLISSSICGTSEGSHHLRRNLDRVV